MILQLVRSKRRQVLIDVNTQIDFLIAEGKACVRNHRRVLAHIRRVMAWARSRGIPIISTCEIYPENSNNGEVHYCIDGTEGQKKVSYTLLNNKISFAADGHTDFPRDMLRRYKQIILHKRCVDPFNEPRIDRLLSEVWANEFVLIGADAEGAIKATALGLLQRGKKVTIVTDAVGAHNKREAGLAFRKMEAKGAKLVETKRLAGLSHLKLVGACGCDSCNGHKRKRAADTAEDD
ncbi:MAG: isochorismatase family protein [Phycisphaerales bacterium]|nr:MAG: isochorismatase family protein [Phycisphaerales bacterium]